VAASVASVAVALAVVVACASCGGGDPSGSAAVTTTVATGPTDSSGSTDSTPLAAPKTSVAQDARFFADVAEADPGLATYQQTEGNVALRALLTDGSAFCALLPRPGGIDQALVTVAAGAREDEDQTHLPQSVTTFNTIEAVALLILCPAEQKLLPAADRARIRALGARLTQPSG
jgi:hypothetical protein